MSLLPLNFLTGSSSLLGTHLAPVPILSIRPSFHSILYHHGLITRGENNDEETVHGPCFAVGAGMWHKPRKKKKTQSKTKQKQKQMGNINVLRIVGPSEPVGSGYPGTIISGDAVVLSFLLEFIHKYDTFTLFLAQWACLDLNISYFSKYKGLNEQESILIGTLAS